MLLSDKRHKTDYYMDNQRQPGQKKDLDKIAKSLTFHGGRPGDRMRLLCFKHVGSQALGPDWIRFYKPASSSISLSLLVFAYFESGGGARNADLGAHIPKSTRGFLWRTWFQV